MSVTGPLQGTYRYYQQRGYYGDVARQHETPIFDSLKSVDSDTLYPGDGVIYDVDEHGLRKPNNVAERRGVVGIVSYDQNRTPDNGSGTNQKIGYDTGDVLKVGVRGTFWAKAGADLEYGMKVEYHETDSNWIPGGTHISGVNITFAGDYQFLGSPTVSIAGQALGVTGFLTDNTVYYFSLNGVPVVWHNTNGTTLNANTARNLEDALHIAGFNDADVRMSGGQFQITIIGGVNYVNPAIVVDIDADDDETVAIAFGR